MPADIVKSCWRSLLLLAREVRNYDNPIDMCSLRFGSHEAVKINSLFPPRPDCHRVTIVLNPLHPASQKGPEETGACFALNDLIHVSECYPVSLSQNLKHLIEIYLPYCIVSLYAKKRKTAFAVSHFAQSLDGRIATSSGESKWIGTHGNFIHAHRMRALCDGVVIGSKTLDRDKPRLTVRHVEGQNPTRIILGSSVNNIDCMTRACRDPILQIGTESHIKNKLLDFLKSDSVNGTIPTSHILKALFHRGIHSVYIEGGASTTARFLREKTLEVLQLHISPMMLGSGVNTLTLPTVRFVSSSIRFKAHRFYPVDDGIMFIGTVKHHPKHQQDNG
jgi:diaminohydroxyphosphoribosylaminopyrimidine deaminase/5-amino-6-(5-phosphoribosylamino)uracil reductase